MFAAIDHCDSVCVGIHASKSANRFEALEPIVQGIHRRFGSYEREIATGLSVRHDHGSQYESRHFQKEISFLGIESSPSFVRSPEGNGIAERFFRTLKEQLLWVKQFQNVEELRMGLLEFQEKYNSKWLVARHNYQTPNQIYENHVASKMAA